MSKEQKFNNYIENDMKVIIYTKYGPPDVLKIKEIEKPFPKDNEMLIKIHAATVTSGDVRMRSATFGFRLLALMFGFSMGLRKPKIPILGSQFSGEIETVGKDVTLFKKGEQVFGTTTGLKFGPYAEYVCADEKFLALKPASMKFDEAAAVPFAAISALQGLRDHGKIQSGQNVLINGASGGVGTFAVQIAKSFGAEVTGVCSTRKVDMVRSLGADHVVDYTQEDFTQSGQRYDLILDNVASRSFSDLRRVLTPQGTIIPNSGHAGMGYVFKALVLSLFVRQQGRPFFANPNNEDLVVLKELIEAGKVTPVIDRTYPLSETSEAFWYLNEGHARGKVVITV